MGTVKKYVCQYGDLDKLLNDTLKAEFQGLFPNPEVSEDKSAWRMYYGEFDLADFLDKFGISYNSPRVRDAVAFDLVKLDDSDENSIGSVSNDIRYTYVEHKVYSPLEYERFLLNKNFRVNLANIEPEWSSITYSGKPTTGSEDDIPISDSCEDSKPSKVQTLRTVDKIYQGARLSKTLLAYFDNIFNNAFEGGNAKSGYDMSQIYVPFTNANDFTTEISLIPHTHPDFRAITSRAYYDKKYIQYKKLLKKYNITGISTFALVDPDRDKNHTGQYLVKVQRKINENKYDYIVATIDKDGKILSTPEVFDSTTNTILCVCAKDFANDRELSTSIDTWTPVESDVPMVKSTTSSHYSVFRQRIPNYDLKQVRHYFQFKNRLQGMELCLWILERSIHMKEVQASECFAKETMVIYRLFQEFAKNKDIMELVKKYYILIAEWDELVVKREQLLGIKDEKLQLLNKMLDEYNALGNNQLDKKLALGAKIQSLKLELDKRIKSSIEAIDRRLDKIRDEVSQINDKIDEIYRRPKYGLTPEVREKLRGTLSDLRKAFNNSLTEEEKREKGLVDLRDLKKYIQDRAKSRKDKLAHPVVVSDLKDEPWNSINALEHDLTDSTTGKLQTDYNEHFGSRDPVPEHEAGGIHAIDTSELHKLILQSERWRGFMFSMGYELNQLKKIKTICEDATIKVRRLVHNFEERMEDVESQVWNSRHLLRKNFSFTNIAAASLREIILLYDWYAANAPGKTYDQMGFYDEEQFLAFRKRCNKISFNLRKNQYANMLNLKRDKLNNLIVDLKNKIESVSDLKYEDKYGEDGAKEHNEDANWSLDDVTKEQAKYVEQQVKPGLGVEVERNVKMYAFTESKKARDDAKKIEIFNDAEKFLSERIDEGIRVLTDELWQRRKLSAQRLCEEIGRISILEVNDFNDVFTGSIGVIDNLSIFGGVELPHDFDTEKVQGIVQHIADLRRSQEHGISQFGKIYGDIEDIPYSAWHSGIDSGINVFSKIDSSIEIESTVGMTFRPFVDSGVNLFSRVDDYIKSVSAIGIHPEIPLKSSANFFALVDGNIQLDSENRYVGFHGGNGINLFGKVSDSSFARELQHTGSIMFHKSIDNGLEVFDLIDMTSLDEDLALKGETTSMKSQWNKWIAEFKKRNLPSYINPVSLFAGNSIKKRRPFGREISILDINDVLANLDVEPENALLFIESNHNRALSRMKIFGNDYALPLNSGFRTDVEYSSSDFITIVGNLDSSVFANDESTGINVPANMGGSMFNLQLFGGLNVSMANDDAFVSHSSNDLSDIISKFVGLDLGVAFNPEIARSLAISASKRKREKVQSVKFQEFSQGHGNIQIIGQIPKTRFKLKSSSVDVFNQASLLDLGECINSLIHKADTRICVFGDIDLLQLNELNVGFVDDNMRIRRKRTARIRVFDVLDSRLVDKSAHGLIQKRKWKMGVNKLKSDDISISDNGISKRKIEILKKRREIGASLETVGGTDVHIHVDVPYIETGKTPLETLVGTDIELKPDSCVFTYVDNTKSIEVIVNANVELNLETGTHVHDVGTSAIEIIASTDVDVKNEHLGYICDDNTQLVGMFVSTDVKLDTPVGIVHSGIDTSIESLLDVDEDVEDDWMVDRIVVVNDNGVETIASADVEMETSVPYVPTERNDSILVFHELDGQIVLDSRTELEMPYVDNGINIFALDVHMDVDLDEIEGRIYNAKRMGRNLDEKIGVFDFCSDYVNGKLDVPMTKKNVSTLKRQIDGVIRVFDIHGLKFPEQNGDVESRAVFANIIAKAKDISVAVFGETPQMEEISGTNDFVENKRRSIAAVSKLGVDSEIPEEATHFQFIKDVNGKIKVFDAYGFEEAIDMDEIQGRKFTALNSERGTEISIFGMDKIMPENDLPQIGDTAKYMNMKKRSSERNVVFFDKMSKEGLIDINEAIGRIVHQGIKRHKQEQSLAVFDRNIRFDVDSDDVINRKESVVQARMVRERGVVVFNVHNIPNVVDEHEMASRKESALDIQHQRDIGLGAFDDTYPELAHEGSNKAMDVLVEASADSMNRIIKFTSLDEYLAQKEKVENQYKMDSELMVDRTIAYLKRIGLISDVDDIEKLALRNRAVQYDGDTSNKIFAIQECKDNLDYAIGIMRQQRESLQSIIDSLEQTENKIKELTQENKNIFNACLLEKDRQNRNRMLLTKLDNESKLMELRGIVKRIKRDHLEDFSELERMRRDVDDWQTKYDAAVKEFKEEVGLNQETMNQLMIGIYNMWQEEILAKEGGGELTWL